jgi:hypothetical protein
MANLPLLSGSNRQPFLLPLRKYAANRGTGDVQTVSGPPFLGLRNRATDQVDARMTHDIPINDPIGHPAEGCGRTLSLSIRQGMYCGQTHKRSFDTNNPSTAARPEPRP